MNEYIIKKVDSKGYDTFLLCLTFESIFDYLDSIESSPLMVQNTGRILIDQLLVSGNGNNRFISCSFKHGKLDLSSACNVQPDDYFKQITVEWLNKNYCYVEHSILTDFQRQCIKNRIIF
ncbi:MAG: type II toxin-antitoxin system RnlB family antitoxin [Acutalibacteraceae bacterium]|nr:type II toxin-antitoxin system RnlB family antitoxin [Acutalibacteraceae bacterium]